MRVDDEFFEAVYEITTMIPKGQVATYGQIATYVVSPRHARAVGRALKLLSPKRSKEIPWHRVINASGRISIRGEVERPIVQRRLLEKEGVIFDKSDKTNLQIFGWTGPPRGWRPPYADPKPAKNRHRAGRS